MRRTSLLGTALVAVLALFTGVAHAKFGASGSGSSTAKAQTLLAPGTPSSTHPNTTGANAGNVSLSWTASASSFVTGYQVQRAPAPCTSPTWTTLTTTVLTSYTDATAAYNNQYCYRVV